MTQTVFFEIVAFVFGAIFGSFINVCIYRLPKGESLVYPQSRCPFCKTKISFYDNIPLLSYLFLCAKCRHCGIHIPFKYFFVEALTSVCAGLIYLKYGFGFLFFAYFAFLASLIIISFIDLEHKIIPNSISIPGTIIGLLLAFVLSYSSIPWPVDLKEAFIGMMFGGGSLLIVGTVYSFITGREGIGFGDVKLLAMFGAFFGWHGAFFAIVIGSMLGLLISLPIVIAKKTSLKYPIPFGPFLSLGLIIYWVCGDFLGRFL